MALMAVAVLIWRWQAQEPSWLEKCVLYISAVLAVYVDGEAQLSHSPFAHSQLLLFVLLALLSQCASASRRIAVSG